MIEYLLAATTLALFISTVVLFAQREAKELTIYDLQRNIDDLRDKEQELIQLNAEGLRIMYGFVLHMNGKTIEEADALSQTPAPPISEARVEAVAEEYHAFMDNQPDGSVIEDIPVEDIPESKPERPKRRPRRRKSE